MAGPDEIEPFFAPDAVQEEFPNRLLPNGAIRDRQAMKEARVRGKALLSAERFEILNAVAGPVRLFMEFRDGRITRQRNYDCFDPW